MAITGYRIFKPVYDFRDSKKKLDRMYSDLLKGVFIFTIGFFLVKFRRSIALSFMKQRNWFPLKTKYYKKFDEIILLVVGCFFMILSFTGIVYMLFE